MTQMTTQTHDVVVIGGGAAGLSGAVALARSRRSVLVLDAGEPRNAPAQGVHNLLGREGIAPAELVRQGTEELRAYGGHVRSARATGAHRTADGFVVEVDGGPPVRARRLLVATGLVDELPAVPGLAARWGRDVLHCPYCHGWEVRDQAVGVLASSPAYAHVVQLFRQLTGDVVLFLHEQPAPEGEALAALTARGIRVVAGAVAGVEVTDDALSGVRLASGEVIARQALAVQTRVVARSAALEALGVAAVPFVAMGLDLGTHVPADPTGLAAPGVWVAGNVTAPMAQVGACAASGMSAGAMINADLIAEEVAAAVAGQG